MKHMRMWFGGLVMSLAFAGLASAGPIQLSLTPDIQVVPASEDVTAVRLSIWGQNKNVSGVDLGFVNQTSGNFKGGGLGIINYVEGDTKGLHVGPWNQTVGTMRYAQLGYVNMSTTVIGAQIGGVNVGETMKGVQFGLVNHSSANSGLQLGLLNIASNTSGWQVGLFNLNTSAQATFPFMVLVNGAF